jgi:alpha-glucosidase
MDLHPPIAPWLESTANGWRVALLTTRVGPLKVLLCCAPDNEERWIEARRAGQNGALQRFEADLPWDRGNSVTRYCFQIETAGSKIWHAADGEHAHPPRYTHWFRVCREHAPPTWARDQVFYQIFVDRFCRGPQAPRDALLHAKGKQPVSIDWSKPLQPGALASQTYFGGDLAGIESKLDYLADLGVTALYLTPIFAAGSNHRYDTERYDEVDPYLGGNEALAKLAAALHARGMRLVLDAVLNHTGVDHPWFNKSGRHPTVGAYQSPQSPYRDWYTFNGDGSYAGWNGHASLPVLNFASESVRAAMYEANDSVLRHWLREPYRVDGWRLDVIHMLGEGPGAHNNAAHVRAIRQAIKAEQPNTYVLGEHFAEASRWLQGDQEDGAMNYFGFLKPVFEWLVPANAQGTQPLSTASLCAWLQRTRGAIPYANQLAQLNLLGSHDTPRFLTRVGRDVDRMRIGLALLFAYPGVPCVYYGDEIGMEGGPDPDCRRPFDWRPETWNRTLRDDLRVFARLRASRMELRHGAFVDLAQGEHWFAFARFTAEAATVVIANRGPETEIEFSPLDIPLASTPKRWADLSGQEVPLDLPRPKLTIPARTARFVVTAKSLPGLL